MTADVVRYLSLLKLTCLFAASVRWAVRFILYRLFMYQSDPPSSIMQESARSDLITVGVLPTRRDGKSKNIISIAPNNMCAARADSLDMETSLSMHLFAYCRGWTQQLSTHHIIGRLTHYSCGRGGGALAQVRYTSQCVNCLSRNLMNAEHVNALVSNHALKSPHGSPSRKIF